MSTLVFLHGHDDGPDRWRAVAEAMAPDGWAVTCPAGPDGRSWFTTDADGLPVAAELAAALDAVAGHVRAAGRDGHGVALAGFSQGAAVALLHAFRYGTVASRTVAVAGWLPDTEGLDGVDLTAPVAGRLLVAHGRDDDVVPFPLGSSVARLLERRGATVSFVAGDGGHDPTPFAPAVRDWLAAGH